MSTLASALAQLRLMANDTATSHRVSPDSLQQFADGVRTVFPASNKNLISPIKVSVAGGALASNTPTDAVFGLVTITPAPALGATVDLYYNYQDYTDAEMQTFLDSGLGEVGQTETTLSTIDVTLLTIACHYAAAMVDQDRMQRFAQQFNTSTEGDSYEMSEVYKAYKAAKDGHETSAAEKRKAYYSRQDRSAVGYSTSTAKQYPPNPLFPRR